MIAPDWLHEGLPVASFEELRETLDVPSERLARVLGISQAALNRRREEGRFTPEESERIRRVSRTVEQAFSALHTLENVRIWMKSRVPALQDEKPLTCMETEEGAREVENVLHRLEYGIFS